MKSNVIMILGLAAAVASYVYLDWGILQIVGALWLVGVAAIVDEQGPIWRKALWVSLSVSIMLLVHFFVTDSVIYWGELLLAVLLFFMAFGSLLGMINHKPGDGSVLTVYFLVLIFCVPVGLFFLYQGLEGLGYLSNGA